MLTILALQRDDLTARAAHVRVNVESFPEMINGGGAWHSTNVKQHADIGLQNRAECVEEPSMRVDLLRVLLLQTEDDLERDQPALCTLELQVGVDGQLCRVPERRWGRYRQRVDITGRRPEV